MQSIRKVKEDILWVGCNDRRITLFENLFPVPKGVSYNSYLILDEKVTLMDTVDASATEQFFENLEAGLAGRSIDYLVSITWSRTMRPISSFFWKSIRRSRWWQAPSPADDRPVLRSGSCGPLHGGEGGGYPFYRKPYLPFRGGADGPLAGSPGVL